mgnify:CR=1 FL=1
MAGLVAAEALGRGGHKVLVLETQKRIGGRALNLTAGLAPGLLAEAGPARFPPDLERTFRLARRFDLDVVPFYPKDGRVVAYLKGRRIEKYEPTPEEFWGYASLRQKYPGMMERLAVRWALRCRAVWHRALGRAPWETYRIRGGTSALAQALFKAVKGEVALGAKVLSVSAEDGGVSVEFEKETDRKVAGADAAGCALPLSMLSQLRFDPGLPSEMTEIIASTPFSSAMRIYVQMDRPFWRDEGQNGFAVTDTIGEVWDPHFDDPRSPSILVCYLQGRMARTLAERTREERVAYAVQELENVFPGALRHFQRGISFCWDAQPWIRGGWPKVGMGFGREAAVFRKPHGRVFFAGDYAANPRWLNTAEGAIESGERVALEIDAGRMEA